MPYLVACVWMSSAQCYINGNHSPSQYKPQYVGFGFFFFLSIPPLTLFVTSKKPMHTTFLTHHIFFRLERDVVHTVAMAGNTRILYQYM